MKPNKLVIFDLDGTLADTVASIAEGMNRAIESKGKERIPEDVIKTFVGSGAAVLARLSYEYRGLPADEESVAEGVGLFNRFYRDVALEAVPYPGVAELLSELKNEGVTLGVYSNKPDVFVRPIVDHLFGEGTFKIAQGQTDRPRKPDPTVLLEIIEEQGSDIGHTVYVGDSDVDVKTALNAGTHLSAVSWGYRSEELLIETGAKFVTNDPAELLRDIKSKLKL